MRRLNNLVTELAAGDRLASGDELTLENSREGWVYLACADGGAFSVDGADVSMREYGGRGEAMAYLPPGAFTVSGRNAREYTVREVPELIYNRVGGPRIQEYGPYDWPYLQRHVLPHVNTIVGGGQPEKEEWKALGGRCISNIGVGSRHHRRVEHNADDVFEYWAGAAGLNDPLVDGTLMDEFFSGDFPAYPAYIEALKRIAADDRFRGKKLYPYTGGHFPNRDDWGVYDAEDQSRSSTEFYRAAMDAGYPIAWERYQPERHEEAIAQEWIEWRMGTCLRDWRRVFPNAARNMVHVFGMMDYGHQLDIHPEADMKVYQDMQFRFIANDEAYDGLRGVMGWHARYANDETVRWMAKLNRHYGIEGNTQPLSDDYGFTFRNDHIYNADFAEHWEGWDVAINIERNCKVEIGNGFNDLQGRSKQGRTYLVLRRSSERPNAVSQPLRNLVPGRLYNVQAIVGDYDALLAGTSEEKRHGVNLEIEGGDVVPEKTFVALKQNHGGSGGGRFDGGNPYWFNFHRTVFRATASTGKLTISDWANGSPDGPVGARNAVNFVQVQDYLED